MNKLTKLITVLLFVFGIAFKASPALAVVRCESTYGGGEVCVRTGELQIDKKVWDNHDGRYEDNLYLRTEDYIFGPGETITFKLWITNVGDKTFNKVYVKDTLPNYLELASGDLEFEIENLSPGETEDRTIEARVVDNFPDNLEVCVPNRAETWSGDERDENTAQVCIREKVLGVTELPPTGPENWLPLLASVTALGSLGFYLLKFSR